MGGTDIPACSKAPRPGARADKRAAIMAAARAVWARDGYSHSSIEAVAAQACVSTRTIYNHFVSKESLLGAVLLEAATRIADAFVEKTRDLAKRDDLPQALVCLGRALMAQALDFPEHFAMVRQIVAEAAHFPPAVMDAWQQAGPLRVQGEVTRLFQEWTDRGLLRIADVGRAVRHFIALIDAENPDRPFRKTACAGAEEVTVSIAAGVEVFLHGYAAPSP